MIVRSPFYFVINCFSFKVLAINSAVSWAGMLKVSVAAETSFVNVRCTFVGEPAKPISLCGRTSIKSSYVMISTGLLNESTISKQFI